MMRLATGVTIFVFTCFLASFFAPSVVASDYVSNFTYFPVAEGKPPKVADWHLTPRIIVCDYAPISKTQLKSAVKFWEKLGHKFFTSQYKHDPLGKCNQPSPIGYILIHLVRQGLKIGEKSLAETHFFIDNEKKEIEWAVIYLRNDVRSTVLEHEIGHSLGYLHYNGINHLMNEKWTMGGWETKGLRK